MVVASLLPHLYLMTEFTITWTSDYIHNVYMYTDLPNSFHREVNWDRDDANAYKRIIDSLYTYGREVRDQDDFDRVEFSENTSYALDRLKNIEYQLTPELKQLFSRKMCVGWVGDLKVETKDGIEYEKRSLNLLSSKYEMYTMFDYSTPYLNVLKSGSGQKRSVAMLAYVRRREGKFALTREGIFNKKKLEYDKQTGRVCYAAKELELVEHGWRLSRRQFVEIWHDGWALNLHQIYDQLEF